MRFEVRIGSSTEPVAGFSEVSGLDFESAIETFREGGVNQYEHQLAGPLKFPARLVLKHGITDNEDLWSWHQDIVQGRIVRKDISIVLRDIDSTRNRKREWKFRAAAPVKWVGPQFRAGGAEVAIETLELIHKGLGQP
jgi:phage tail-like protein